LKQLTAPTETSYAVVQHSITPSPLRHDPQKYLTNSQILPHRYNLYTSTSLLYETRISGDVVTKVGGAGSWTFSTDSCKYPTEEIMGAQNFNFARKYSQNGRFKAPILYF